MATIREYFKGQSILITGSTGTLGKILVEKILRCCPDVARVYLLIREKKNTPIEERWKKITDLPLFDLLKKSNPKALDKVSLIMGDLRLDNMGISVEDKQILLENVTMIYHVAAMVQFTDSLTLSLINNTKATHMLLNFARAMKKLQLFLHVSTAFCNMNIPCEKAIEEVIPATIDWRVILKLLETQPHVLDLLREKLLCGQPNPYTWSKWLSEQIVNEYREYFPTVITRPAVVSTTVREPYPGWLDSIDGICAVVQAAGFGVLRVALTTSDSFQDYVPADAAVNSIIVASWKKYKEPSPERTDVYNCCIYKDVPMGVRDYQMYGRATVEEEPSAHLVWPARCYVTTNELLYKILFVLLQIIPAALADLVNWKRNKKTMAMKMTIRVANMLRIYKKFSVGQIAFPNDKYKALNNIIPKEEWDIFNTVYEGLDSRRVITLSYVSVKKCFLKEVIDEESLARNKRRYRRMVLIDETIIFCLWMLLFWLIAICLRKFLPF